MNRQDSTVFRVIDSHTAGEPTRVVIEGVPSLGDGPMRSRREHLSQHSDWLRTSLIWEPRGAPWMVGAVLQQPVDPACAAGVIFFNNTGYLGMCGHGLIGVVTTLAHLGRIDRGVHRLETPVGAVTAQLHDDGTVSLQNVVSYRTDKDATVEVPGIGSIVGDVAYGGNWFFLTELPQVEASMIDDLVKRSIQIRSSLKEQGIRGSDGSEIDHIAIAGPPSDPAKADAKNFVMCPGGHYDRSPCGTGASAKLACLAADGKLAPGTVWVQESITNSVYEASYQQTTDGILPTIRARAFITGETSVIIDPEDLLRHGFNSSS
ncbi:MAG: proline racemase family protein [Pirellulales bacterium]|nr:proline racemase family protein [Pirellulales bacterium]